MSPQYLAAPGPALETYVGGDVNSMLLINVLSGTEYTVKIIASYNTGSSEPLSGRVKTCKFVFCLCDLLFTAALSFLTFLNVF